MKTALYLLAIFALYGFASDMDYQDQIQAHIVECDTDYDCMIKNPQIEEFMP